MKFEYFIAQRFVKSTKGRFSNAVVRLASISVALGLAVMIIAVAVLNGFQKEIREKVIGFGSHIQIVHFESGTGQETVPVSTQQSFYPDIALEEGIRHIQVYGTKAGIIKTDEDIHGVVLKGIGPDFDWGFFESKIVDGRKLQLSDSVRSDEVLISKLLARKLGINPGDDLRMYFVTKDAAMPRGRKFKVVGIYETGLYEFDQMMLFGDITHIRKLNGWGHDQAGGFEVLINDFDQLDAMDKLIYDSIGYELNTRTIKQMYPQIFDWLALQDMNVLIILVIMVMVAGISMISTLLIIILEKTSHIGLLKALGARDSTIREVFIYHAVFIIGRGLFWGNLIGLGIALVQYKYRLIGLPQDSYYVDHVPVQLYFSELVLLNIATVFLCVMMMLLPSMVISRITPLKAIRYD